MENWETCKLSEIKISRIDPKEFDRMYRQILSVLNKNNITRKSKIEELLSESRSKSS